MKILIVEDDIFIGNLEEELLKNRYKVSRAYSGTEAIMLFERENFDLVILDLMLPGLSGEEVLAKIKNKTRVIVTSAKSSTSDKVDNLINGANDFISKPFENDEFIARVEVQLRTHDPYGLNRLRYNDLCLDKSLFTATINERDLKLTKLEFGILYFLMSNPNKVFTKNQIFENVWNYDSIGTEESVKVHISNIRTKIACYSNEKYIETIWGIGFKFVMNLS